MQIYGEGIPGRLPITYNRLAKVYNPLNSSTKRNECCNTPYYKCRGVVQLTCVGARVAGNQL